MKRAVLSLVLAATTLGLGNHALAATKQPSAAEYASLVKELARVNAVNEVSNLMSRYTFLQLADKQVETAQLYALNTPGVKVQLPSGEAAIGGDQVKQFYEKSQASKKPEGMFHLHPMQTPVIEVAGDGQTARGVFLSLGAGANDANDTGAWVWVKYGVDFVKENGTWKIWHLHAYPLLVTSYDKSWTQTAKERAAGGGKPGGGGPPPPGAAAPNGQANGQGGPQGGPPPSSSSAPKEEAWIYNGKGVPPLQPALPNPYQTFDPSNSY